MFSFFRSTRAKTFRLERLHHVFSDADPASLDRLRKEAELAVHERPRDPVAHAALSCALVASVRAGLTDDLDEDAALAEAAAAQALHLAPADPHIIALCAPAIAWRDPPQAGDMIENAGRSLKKLPSSLYDAARGGAIRPRY